MTREEAKEWLNRDLNENLNEMEEMTIYINEIIYKVNEKQDDFIFTTISRFMGQDLEMSKIVMSKRILCRALECFKQEHAEEYYRLVDECNERTKEG